MFSRRTDWELRPNRFALALEKHRRSGRELLDLTASNPTHCGFRYDEQAILAALVNREALEYRPEPKGLLRARQAVADYYRSVVDSSDHPITRSPDDTIADDRIILITSTSEAYSFVFRLLCDPGDEVLIPTPSYPLFEYLAGLQDVKLISYPLFYDHGWHIDLHALETALTPRTRAVLVVHPNNPTGSYVKPQEAVQLNVICSARNLALIADEVFLDYALAAPQPTFAANQDALTFTLSGISKISGLPQMKLAWMVVSGPEVIVRTALSRLELIADTYLSLNGPVQLAAPVLLDQRRSFQPQLISRVRANLAELDRQLGCCPGVPHPERSEGWGSITGTVEWPTLPAKPEGRGVRGSVTRLQIEGGWYAILRVPVTGSDEDLAIALLEKQNVLVQPGYFYDFHADGYLVVSLITPEEQFREGIARVLAFC
ncbi:MAG: pyridoxal phosphate-dependent aminotransferase [Terriglobales bacterium]